MKHPRKAKVKHKILKTNGSWDKPERLTDYQLNEQIRKLDDPTSIKLPKETYNDGGSYCQ